MLKSYDADAASIGESGVAVPCVVRSKLQTCENVYFKDYLTRGEFYLWETAAGLLSMSN